jgi:uncharacterized protein YuzE
MIYFEQEDILHIAITEGDEEASYELSPNVTVELDSNNEVIGVEILDASAFLRDTVLESVQARVAHLFQQPNPA